MSKKTKIKIQKYIGAAVIIGSLMIGIASTDATASILALPIGTYLIGANHLWFM